jgi:hypothetical protein
MQVESYKVKAKETHTKKYGGIGFAGSSGLKSINTMMKERNIDNIMKTEEGKISHEESCLKNLGVKNPMMLEEIRLKVSETLTGQPSQLKGKTYPEIHGEERAIELIEEKRISGAKGYEKSRRLSKPQIDLYILIDSIWDTCMLDFKVMSKFLDVSIGELQLDFEYDSSFYHDNQKESDDERTKLLSGFNWKVIRFIDKLPTRQEIEKIIKERIIEIDEINKNGIIINCNINCLQKEILNYMNWFNFPKLIIQYKELNGNDDEETFVKRFIILKKIINNTYNQCSYDDLVEVWNYYIKDPIEGLKYLELINKENITEFKLDLF